jgi:hypothetical protein
MSIDDAARQRQFSQAWLAENGQEIERLIGSIKSDVERIILLQRMQLGIALARQQGGDTERYFESNRATLQAGLAINPANSIFLNIERHNLTGTAPG